MRRHHRLWSLATLGALLLVTAAADAVSAATKRFKPLDFTPFNSSVNFTRSPEGLGGIGSLAYFSAPLGLPAGSRITGIRFYSSGPGVQRTAEVSRWGGDTIAYVVSIEAVPSTDTPALTSGALLADGLIDASGLYYVQVSADPGTIVWAVDVDYTR